MTKRLFRAMFAMALAVLLCTVACVLGAVNAYFTKVQARQLQVEAGLPDHLDFPGGKGAL